MNMSKFTSAVWCTCDRDNLFKSPDKKAKTCWEDALAFYDSVGCQLKSLRTICELNHFSYEVLLEQPFREFSCRCGYQSGNEASSWRAQVEAHAQLELKELKEFDLEHSAQPLHCRHKPFCPPLLHQDAIDNSADILHLIFINMFAMLMELTMFVYLKDMDVAAREPFEVYMRSIGVPVKVVSANDTTEMKQSLNGRDAKTIIAKAAEHIPHLLEFVHLAKVMAYSEVDHAEADQQPQRDTPRQECPRRMRPATDEDEVFDWESDEEESRGR
ncbi:hypothetical protein AB1Y20_000409 [Prymnesium parvum]|uniref:Uncharacterized protein n=1 Tax=Prymnesium parvum TaxID=97485 RepID=A0AB34K7V2_PRYPA